MNVENPFKTSNHLPSKQLVAGSSPVGRATLLSSLLSAFSLLGMVGQAKRRELVLTVRSSVYQNRDIFCGLDPGRIH